MKILAFDTTTPWLILGLSDGKTACSCAINAGRRHSELLLPAIQRCLHAKGWQFSGLDYIACGQGPGSFTGIRIGLSTAKGLAWGLRKPVVAIPTMDVIAGNAISCHEYASNRPICVAIDARRGLVFASIYRFRQGAMKRVSPVMLLTPAELSRRIPAGSLLTGDALGIYSELFARTRKHFTLLDKDFWYPDGVVLSNIAAHYIARKQLTTAAGLKALYVYPKECQIKGKR